MGCSAFTTLAGVSLLLPLAWPDPPVDARSTELPFDFAYDILPLLERQGCASAYCHGSAKGKGGFKLSLFGSDPDADYRAITQDLDGRRVDYAKPHRSLVLRKPSLALTHGGGRKLPKESAAYRDVVRWIAGGAPRRTGEVDLRGLSLSLTGRQLTVLARFEAGGSKRHDVTDLAMYSSSDEAVATVDDAGRITWHRPGGVWFLARYAGHHARLQQRRSFGKPRSVLRKPNALDETWERGIAKVGLWAVKTQADVPLVRRMFLDLIDRPPTPRELSAFLQDSDVEATARRLMARPEFAQKWGRLLADWLEIPDPDAPGRNNRRENQKRLRADLTGALRRGDKLRDVARRFLTMDRRLLSRYSDPRDRAEFVGRAFLGMRIGCARCHNHPLDRWTQDEHLAFSAYFADRRPDGKGGQKDGVLFHPETAAPIRPELLPLVDDVPAAGSHAEQIARFVLDASHGRFSRNLANRVFKELMGNGLVEPVDDHRLSNPARNEALLDALSTRFASGGLRELCVAIVTARMYRVGHSNDKRLVRYLAAREAVPLSSPAFRRAVCSVLGVQPNSTMRLPASPLARQLALLNGRFLHDALVQQNNNLQAILDFEPKAENRLQEIYRLILTRDPREAERKKFLPLLRGNRPVEIAKNARELAFALLASREFGSKR